MKKVALIKNEQHELLESQMKALNQVGFPSVEILNVPASGWSKSQMDEVIGKLRSYDSVIFLSPIPYLLARLSYSYGVRGRPVIYVFHNDKREKVELPNGKIVFKIPEEGWGLVKVG